MIDNDQDVLQQGNFPLPGLKLGRSKQQCSCWTIHMHANGAQCMLKVLAPKTAVMSCLGLDGIHRYMEIV